MEDTILKIDNLSIHLVVKNRLFRLLRNFIQVVRNGIKVQDFQEQFYILNISIESIYISKFWWKKIIIYLFSKLNFFLICYFDHKNHLLLAKLTDISNINKIFTRYQNISFFLELHLNLNLCKKTFRENYQAKNIPKILFQNTFHRNK